MNRPYPKYNPEIGVPTAYSHHGQQHHLHKQPGCKAANLSNFHNAKTCSPWADHVRRFRFLRQAEAGMPVKEVCRSGGFSDATFYKWRAKFGGMEASQAARLRELEAENAKLKKLLAEAHLDIHALKGVFGVKR